MNNTPDEDFFKKYDYEMPKVDENGDEDFFKNFDEQHTIENAGGEDVGFFLNTERDYVIEQVKKDGMHLEKAPMYENDIEVVTMAVENNGKAYQFASKYLQENGEVAELFVDIKKVQIKEAEGKPNSDALIAHLQQEIEAINEIHQKALEEKEYHSHYMGMHR